MNKKIVHLIRDLILIIFSVVFTVIIVKTGVLNHFFQKIQRIDIVASFVAGMFFTSIFTTAPSIVILAEISKTTPLLFVVFLGGLGALLGDLIIFRFIKQDFSEDVSYLIKKTGTRRLFSIFHLKIFRWLVPFIGALIIASPLPDEIGIAMMGFSKMKTYLFIPISFVMNSLGILIIALIARAVI